MFFILFAKIIMVFYSNPVLQKYFLHLLLFSFTKVSLMICSIERVCAYYESY